MKLDQATALITGGASGIGLAVAEALLLGNARVLLTDRNNNLGYQECRRLKKNHGTRVEFMLQDVRDVNSFSKAFHFATEQFGKEVNVFFNNAGIGEDGKILRDPNVLSWREVVDIDLNAVIRGVQVAVNRMPPGSVIVNTASAAGLWPMSASPVYSAAKHGVIGFTLSLEHLHAKKGIRVNAICPAFTDTPLVQSELEHNGKLKEAVESFGGLIDVSVVASGVLDIILDESRFGELMRITKKKGARYIVKNPTSRL